MLKSNCHFRVSITVTVLCVAVVVAFVKPGAAQQSISPDTAPPAAVAENHDVSRLSALPETITAHAITSDVDVTDSQMLNANRDKDNWLLYGRTYDNQRFSPLTQISKSNVKKLRPVAIIQTGIANSTETNPIVVNGIMYISTPSDHVQAYDAVTGRMLWSYTPADMETLNLCCGPQSRGVAVAYGKVFLAQLDAKMVALDARTGKLVWKSDLSSTMPPDSRHFSYTSAPLVYDGMVVIGSAGAEFPMRGFVQAYDANTGEIIWRFRTTAAPDEPGGDSWSGDSWKTGGGSVWNTPAYDPKNGLISFAVGNPNPDVDGDDRLGANAYTDSMVALHSRDGKLAWWNQQVPHDQWDLDATGPVIFFDAKDENGKSVPAAGEAGKEGHVFIVNRLTGELLRKSQPFVLESPNKFTPPTEAVGEPHYPSVAGGGQWSPSAFSPLTHDFYVMGTNAAYSYQLVKDPPGAPDSGIRFGGKVRNISEGSIESSGTLTAIDVNSGNIAWQYKSGFPMLGGVLATASNLVFAGEMDGNFNAFDAQSGRKLWHFNLGTGVCAPPVTYRVNGVQYVAVAAGGNGANGMQRLTASRGLVPFGDVVAIFALPDQE